jgi:hypothetical protein
MKANHQTALSKVTEFLWGYWVRTSWAKAPTDDRPIEGTML